MLYIIHPKKPKAGNLCRIIKLEDIISPDALHKICSYLNEQDLPFLLQVSKYFYHVIRPYWWALVNLSPFLQKKKRFYDHSVAKSLSIVYCAIERPHLKKFIGAKDKLGVTVYSYVSSGLNVFVRVRPPAIGHTIGIRYTFNQWRGENITYGWWVQNENDEELWRINLSYDEEDFEEMWFSVFVKDSGGQEAWDTNNGWNYTAHIHDIPVMTYMDAAHPAIQQHTRNFQYNRITETESESEEDFIEEVWLTTYHIPCE